MALAHGADHNHTIHGVGEQRCVGHRQQRGSIHDHQEFLGELFDKLAHLVGTQQFGRVRGNTPGGKHKELGILYLVHSLSNINLTGKNLRQTNFGVNVQFLRDGGTAQVGVDQDDRLPRACHRARHRQRDRRLTLARNCGGHNEGARRVIDIHEAQVRAQLTDRFVGNMVIVAGVHDVFFRQVIADGQHTQNIAVCRLNGIVTSADALVHGTAQEDRQVHEHQPGTGTDEAVLHVVGRYERRVHAGVIQRDHTNQGIGGIGRVG